MRCSWKRNILRKNEAGSANTPISADAWQKDSHLPQWNNQTLHELFRQTHQETMQKPQNTVDRLCP